VFVHSRKDTTRTAEAIRMKAMKESTIDEFSTTTTPAFDRWKDKASIVDRRY
jgi:hypothetical protein